MIYIPFGDSHSLFLAGATPSSPLSKYIADTPAVYWLGPAKIWGLYNSSVNCTREKLKSLEESKIFKANSIAIASFGEIDIRINIPPLCLAANDFSPISSLAKRYLCILSQLGCDKIIIWGPPPTRYIANDLRYPAVLDPISRNTLTHIFNSKIIELLPRFPKLSFVTLFYNFVDEALRTTGGLIDDIHYNTDFSDVARSVIQDALNKGIRFSLNFDTYDMIRPPLIGHSTSTTEGYSRQLFQVRSTNLHFWSHRTIVENPHEAKNVQFRVNHNAYSDSFFPLKNRIYIPNDQLVVRVLETTFGKKAAREYQTMAVEWDKFIQNQFT